MWRLGVHIAVLAIAGSSAARYRGEVDLDGGPKLNAHAVLVIHNLSGRILLARHANDPRPIASLTKVAASLVVRQRGLQLKAGTTISRADWQVALKGARTRLELKWTYQNSDLLHAALMASDNRAVSALGRAVGLDAAGLVQAMNQLAVRLKLAGTRFKGPVGIDPENVSTAWDVSRLVRLAANDAVLSEIMAKKQVRIKPLKGYLPVYYRNTNPLVGNLRGVRFKASKTGFNKAAGYCLAAVVRLPKLGSITYITLGSKTKINRVIDSRRIIRWVQANGPRKLAEQS